MKYAPRNPTIAICLAIMAAGCLHSPRPDNLQRDQSTALDEVHAAASAFKMKPETDRMAEGKCLALAIDNILVYPGKRVDARPNLLIEEYDPKDASSPLAESQLIEWAGKPTERYSGSMSYLMKRFSESEGPQTESLVIILRNGVVVGTSRSTAARYY